MVRLCGRARHPKIEERSGASEDKECKGRGGTHLQHPSATAWSMAEVVHPNLLNIVSEKGVTEVNSLPCNGRDPWWPPHPVCHMIWQTRGLAQGSCTPLAPSLDSSTWAGGQQWHHQHLHVRKLHVWGSWALKKDYYYTTEMQSWDAKMAGCVCTCWSGLLDSRLCNKVMVTS